MSQRRPHGFTLVELLVVIGIIAVLISVLLPALQTARRQAQTVKCSSALREIGNAFQMYAIDNKGWFPPSQIQPPTKNYGATYKVNEISYPNSGVGAYWFNFLAKYMTKGKTGVEALNPGETGQQMQRSIFWSCPAWEGYLSGSAAGGGYNRIQTGYGMNLWPTFRADYPTSTNFPPQKEESAVIGSTSDAQAFFKQVVWTRNGSERMLVSDSRFWAAESNKPPTATSYPPTVVAQPLLKYDVTYTSTPGQTMVDLFRHGKYPGVGAPGEFKTNGGKIAFNILYCDGHVATANMGDVAYKTLRMKFPG